MLRRTKRPAGSPYWASLALKVGAVMSLLVVVTTFLVNELLRGQGFDQGWALLVAVVVLLSTALFTFILDRVVTQPVLSLADQVRRMVSEGNFQDSIVSSASDEVGDLALSMDALRQSFLAQKRSLEELNRELDQKVQERTEALEQAQDQLIRTERLASVGRLSGGVAHEINNPTGVIMTRSEFLLETAEEEGLSADVREDLEAISRNAKRIARITSSLLSFSRQVPSEMGPVDPGELIDEALALVSHTAKQASVEVSRDWGKEMPPVLGDRAQLEQVFVNLFRNAIDAMADLGSGGALTVECESQGEFLVMSVADTGPGLEPEVAGQVFEPFFTTKETGKGTGLGLSITYGIVADHDGEISVESEPGAGAKFVVRLPLCKEGSIA